MIVVGRTFLYLGTAKKYEPLLLVPIGFGILEVHLMCLKEDPTNFLLMHGMACNSSGVIGSAICVGILWSFFI